MAIWRILAWEGGVFGPLMMILVDLMNNDTDPRLKECSSLECVSI